MDSSRTAKIKLFETFRLNFPGVRGIVWKRYSTFAVLRGRPKHMEKFCVGLEIVLTRCKLLMSLTPAHIKHTCELKKINTCLLPHSYTLLQTTIVAQFDVAKQPLIDIKPMSTAFIKLQVLPLGLANLITIIELPTLTSGFSLASFPGPAQLSVAFSTVLQATESWAGPGNEARFSHHM